jgi:hypothetical protein
MNKQQIRDIARKHYPEETYDIIVVSDYKRIRELRRSQNPDTWGQGVFPDTDVYRLAVTTRNTPRGPRPTVMVCDVHHMESAMATAEVH